MKKLKEVFAVLVMFFIAVTTVVGCSCGKNEIEKMVVKSGLRDTYLVKEPVDFSDIKIEVTYEDGTTEIVGKSDVEISEFSTAVAGTYDVKISYKDKEIKVSLKVTNNKDEVYEIIGVQNNKNFIQYNNALKDPDSEADLESVFANRTKNEANMYVVGDDNPFVYTMNITALDTNGVPVEGGLQATKTVTKVYYKSTFGGDYTLLNDSEVANKVEINSEQSSYQFLTQGFYKLEVRPYYLDEVQLLNVADYTKTIEFKVVDGYNVTDPKQLGVLYNVSEMTDYTEENDTRKDVNLYTAWGEFLGENDITQRNVNAIVLHNDITITGADIPKEYLTKPANLDVPLETVEEEATNELALYTDSDGEDWVLEDNMSSDKCGGTNIYCHEIANNSTFNFYGNFFTLKAALPTVDTDILANYGSTSSLFRFVSAYSNIEDDVVSDNAKNTLAVTTSQSAIANIINLNTIGNATRTDSTDTTANATSARMGGLIFVKAPAVTLNITNSIIKSYLINIYLERRLTTINLDNVKSYDAYQSIVYGYQGGVLNITNSELKRAGGPVILLATEDNRQAMKHTYYIDVQNSTLESLITGTEPWFVIYNKVEVAGYLKSSAEELSSFQSTYVDGGFVNLIMVSQLNSDTNNVNNSVQAMAKMTIDGVVYSDTTEMSAQTISNPYNAGLNEATLNGSFAFGSKNGAYVGTGGVQNVASFVPTSGEHAGDVGYAQGLWAQALMADNDEGAKDYLGIYAPNMSIVAEYFAIPAVEE